MQATLSALLAKATADRALLDGRLMPIRAVKIVRLLDEALAGVAHPQPVREDAPFRRYDAEWPEKQ